MVAAELMHSIASILNISRKGNASLFGVTNLQTNPRRKRNDLQLLLQNDLAFLLPNEIDMNYARSNITLQPKTLNVRLSNISCIHRVFCII